MKIRKPQTQKLLTLLFIAFLLFPACKKDKPAPPEKEWHEYQELQGTEKVILDGRRFSDSLVFMGTDAYIILRESNSSGVSKIKKSTGGSKTWNEWERPLIHRNIIISRYDGNEGVLIGTNVWSNNSLDTMWLDMKKHDSRFEKIRSMPIGMNGTFITNNQNQILIHYTRRNTLDSISIMMVDIDFNELKNRGPNAFRTKIIDIPENLLMRNWHVFGENYFINMAKGTYLLTPSGNLTRVINDGWIMRMFEAKINPSQLKPYIFAIAIGKQPFLISKDGGLNWEDYSFNLNYQIDYSIYTNVDGAVIGFLESNLFHLQISNAKTVAKRLKNKGLEGKFITSVNKLNGKYYVSTLSGLFVKDEADFFDYID